MRSTFQILALFLSVVFLNASSAGAEVYLNHAFSGMAKQKGTLTSRGITAEAKLAIDGKLTTNDKAEGSFYGASVQHTNPKSLGNWWQVDLGGSKKIDKIEIWNRTDGANIRRLFNFYIFISKEPFENEDASKLGIETVIKQVIDDNSIDNNSGSIYYVSARGSNNRGEEFRVAPYTESTDLGYTNAPIVEEQIQRGFTSYTLDLSDQSIQGQYVRVQLVGGSAAIMRREGGSATKQLHMAEVKVLEDVTPGLSVIKESNKVGERVNVNDVITYTYTVKNTGKSTISDVELSDDHRGKGVAPVPTFSRIVENVDPQTDLDTTITNGKMASIGPGDTVEFTATYTVTQDDIDLLQ